METATYENEHIERRLHPIKVGHGHIIYVIKSMSSVEKGCPYESLSFEDIFTPSVLCPRYLQNKVQATT